MLYTSDYKPVNIKREIHNKRGNSECQKIGIFAEKTA